MASNRKQEADEDCSHSASGSEHRIDIAGLGDATTSANIFARLTSLQEQVDDLQRQVILEITRPRQSFRIQGKSLETLKQEEEKEQDEKEKKKKDVRVRIEDLSTLQRVQNRLWIKQNTVYNEVLEDGERSLKIITERVNRREKRVEDLTNQVFNLVGFFSVFQGVILTAVTQLSTSVTTQLGGSARPLCGKVWVPVVLSVLAAVVTIVSVLLKFKHLYTLDKSIHDEKNYQKVAANKIEKLQSRGELFKFFELPDVDKNTPTTYWGVKCFFVIGALILLTALLILSYFVILCDKWVRKGWN